MSEHAKNVLKWREAHSVLPDVHFFDLVRMYLGEVKTPYNKQKLIEELSAFIRKAEVKNTLIQLLSESDVMIITAVMELPYATQENLNKLFSQTFGFAELYERLMNLEERLILFQTHDASIGKNVYRINPFLDEEFEKIKNLSILLPPCDSKITVAGEQKISEQLLAAFVSFISMHPGLCKNDGSLKKKTIQLMEETFSACSDKINIFTSLIKAFIYLGVYRDCDGELRLVKSKWEQFVLLSENERYFYLAAALAGPCSRTEFFRRAQLVSDIVLSIPEKGFEKDVLYRSAFLLNEKSTEHPSVALSGTSRFQALLAQEYNVKTETENKNYLDVLLEGCKNFGLLTQCISEKDGTTVYTTGINKEEKQYSQKFISLDGTFNISVMPGMSLADFFDVAIFSDIRRFDTVSTYEITRNSCMRSFDMGYTPEKIWTCLNKILLHSLPQVLKDSIDEWYKIYNSATIYRGYVLQVSQEKQILVENNSEISKHIKKVLAPGIFLLDYETEEETQASIEKSNLDFIGQTKTTRSETASLPFGRITKMPEKMQIKPAGLIKETEREKHFTVMREKLRQLDLPKEKEEGLLERIQQKIILIPEQLNSDSVRFEKKEATGMDFAGKIHIIEYAIQTNNLIEMTYDDLQSENGRHIYVGTPISLEKRTGDRIVKLRLEPDMELKDFSVGQARIVRRLRGSIFKQ